MDRKREFRAFLRCIKFEIASFVQKLIPGFSLKKPGIF